MKFILDVSVECQQHARHVYMVVEQADTLLYSLKASEDILSED